MSAAPLWASWYRVGDGPLRYFSAQAQPARECPASQHQGATMHLGAVVPGGEFVVLEVRKAKGKGWRSVWRDDSKPWT